MLAVGLPSFRRVGMVKSRMGGDCLMSMGAPPWEGRSLTQPCLLEFVELPGVICSEEPSRQCSSRPQVSSNHETRCGSEGGVSGV